MIVVCLGVPSASAVEALTPLVETTDMNGSSDVADDMCVWLHPTDRSKSIIFGNNKTDGDDPEGGIYCYALDGGPTDTLSPDTLGWGAGNWFDQGKKVNNVDVRYNFQAGSEQWDLVVGGNRTDERIDIFRVDTDAGGDFTGLTKVGSIQTDSSWIPSGNNIGNDSPYGLAMFHSKSQNKLYAIASSKGGRVAQWEMSYNAGTELIPPFIEGTRVWMTPLVAFGGASDFNELVEGIVADDEKDVVYIAGENTSIYRYQTVNGVIQDAGRVTVASVGDGNLTADIEGLTMYYASDGEGYLIASSQGSSQYAVYDREFSGSAPNAYIKNFSIVGNAHTDGIDVVNVNLGGSFTDGMFLAHSGDGSPSNIKLVDWADVANATGPPLLIDTSWDPRPAGFEAWQITHFGNPPAAEADPGLDPDFDSMANLLEYALGKNPHVSDQAAGNIEAGVITFTKGAGVDDDVTFTIEESDDLGVTDPWEAVTADVNDANEISYSRPLDKDAIFVRLKVTLAE